MCDVLCVSFSFLLCLTVKDLVPRFSGHRFMEKLNMKTNVNSLALLSVCSRTWCW